MQKNKYEIQFSGYEPWYIDLPLTEETNPFEVDFEKVGGVVESTLMGDADCNGWHHGVCEGEDFQVRNCDEVSLSDEEIERRESCERYSD